MEELCSKFKVKEKLGGGSFGEIRRAFNVITHEELAAKLESKNLKHPQLENEYKFYRLLAGGVGIPFVKQYR